ncbi:MAG: nucleotidyltransferase [Candidatus Gottesmanbacteria bacterium GW2011_GWA2_43_14]|uniref:Nucleotidyltransferase n=1 Tax=Candidatus Gottesmanbacteria bacterium GW2011_GWA2_43_14 TaxID=1618443 RepID=A0A0G1DJY3_9BACT|nr:MAG: nucleotidyltransferase [Candidatus Gottesmanbacteria bacterium GW2011_GWA2_43_14]
MDRERLTITLKKSILSKVDALIDGTDLRNRSHAIETLISRSLTPTVNQAVILAGGSGVNMRPFTFEMPKGLFPVGGKPILEKVIELLREYEVRHLLFSIGHLGEKIQEYFGDGRKFGVKIDYIREKESAGTGGALILVKKYLNDDSFFVVHGDILIDINLSDMIAFHKNNDVLGTIAVTTVLDPSSYGEVVMNGTKITQFIEKPEKGMQKSQLISCGLYILEKGIFSYLPKKGPAQLEDIFTTLAKLRQLAAFPFSGRFTDIGTPKSYEKAIKEWGSVKEA